jgi:hypothetical protein
MFLNNKGEAMEKTHPPNRHHIHSLQDLEDSGKIHPVAGVDVDISKRTVGNLGAIFCYRRLSMQSVYDLWQFTESEQQALLGTDIGTKEPSIVVELDLWSTRMFYNERFAPLIIRQCECRDRRTEVFQVILHSIDDASVNMTWTVKSMNIKPYEARQLLDEWLKRSNYFVNLRGLEAFCNVFGKYESNNN